MDPHQISQEDLENMFQSSDRDLVSTLGGKVNLGGTHANAVCSLAGFDPNIDTQKVDSKKIHDALQTLLNDLAESDAGYLLLKPDEEHSLSQLEKSQNHIPPTEIETGSTNNLHAKQPHHTAEPRGFCKSPIFIVVSSRRCLERRS